MNEDSIFGRGGRPAVRIPTGPWITTFRPQLKTDPLAFESDSPLGVLASKPTLPLRELRPAVQLQTTTTQDPAI